MSERKAESCQEQWTRCTPANVRAHICMCAYIHTHTGTHSHIHTQSLRHTLAHVHFITASLQVALATSYQSRIS